MGGFETTETRSSTAPDDMLSDGHLDTQRFEQPLYVCEDPNSDILVRLTIREARLFQEVDTGSSSQITLRATAVL